MCKTFDTCYFVFGSVLDRYKSQEIRDKVVHNDPFIIKYSLHRYKTQEMCDKAVDHFLSAVKFVPDFFVKSKLIRNLNNALWADDDILAIYKYSSNVTLSSDEMGILNVDINNINIDDFKFDEDDTETIIHVRLMAWRNRLKQRKAFKKYMSKELMLIA